MSSVDTVKNFLGDCLKQLGTFLFTTWQGRLILGGAGLYLLKDRISSLFKSTIGDKNPNTPGSSFESGGLKVNVTSSINPSDPNETYVRVTVDPQTDTAKKVAAKAEFYILGDESGSMFTSADMKSKRGSLIHRMASVLEGIKELVKFGFDHPSCDFKVSFCTFDTAFKERFTQIKSSDVTKPSPGGNLDGINFSQGGTDIKQALVGMTNYIKTLPDDSQTPRVLIVLTDGEDISFLNSSQYNLNQTDPLIEFQTVCKQKNMSVVAVGMSNSHDRNVLKKIITESQDANGRPVFLPNSRYYFIDGNPVVEGSSDHNEGKRTFPQLVEEVCSAIASKTHDDMSISLGCDSSIIGSDKIKKANKLYRLGELANAQVEIILKVKTDSKPCEINFKATPLDGSQPVDIKLSHPLNTKVNNEVFSKVIVDELKRALSDACDTYNYQKADTFEPSRKIIQNALARSAVLNPKPQEIISLEEKLRKVLAAINSGQQIDDATGRAVLSIQTRLPTLSSGSSDPSKTGSSGVTRQLTANNAYSAAGANRPNTVLGTIQKTIKDIYEGIRLSVAAKINRGQMIINPEAAKLHGLAFPLGYDILGLESGTILSIPPGNTNNDGSINAEFIGDSEIAAFCARHKLHFKLVMQPECQINLDLATKKALLIPDDATHFQWIDPSALEPVFDDDCDPGLKWKKDDEFDDKAPKRNKLDELMAKELSPIACNLLNVGGFIYHSGHHFVDRGQNVPPPPVEKRNFCFANGIWEDAVTKQRYYEDSPEADKMKRVTSQIRVVNSPFKALPNQVLPLGKPASVPAAVHDTLKEWTSHLEECPYMSEVTIPDLRAKGLKYFKWLNPGDPLIKQTKEHLYQTCQTTERVNYAPNGGWGNYGVYVYYSDDPTKSCMSPVVSLSEAVRNLKGKYFSCEIDPVSQTAHESLISDTCVVCYDKPPAFKFDSCDHPPKKDDDGNIIKGSGKAIVCGDCLPHIIQGQRVEDPYSHGVSYLNACQCPECRTTFNNAVPAAANSTDVVAEIGKNHKNIPFSLGKIDIDYGVSDWLTRGLLQNPTFLSKKYPINDKIRNKFNLPASCQEWAFVYPVYGKQLSDAFSEVIMAHEIISRLNADADNEEEANLMAGLFTIGGFAFFDTKGTVQSAYSFLGDKKVSNSITVNAELSTNTAKKGAIDAAYTKLLETQKKDEIKQGDQPDIGRITLGLFFPFAEYFQFAGDSFSYRSHDGTGNAFFSYRLTDLIS